MDISNGVVCCKLVPARAATREVRCVRKAASERTWTSVPANRAFTRCLQGRLPARTAGGRDVLPLQSASGFNDAERESIVVRENTALRISLARTVETGAHRRDPCRSPRLPGFSLVARIGKTFPPSLQVRARIATQHTSIYSKYAIDLGLCMNLSAAAERVALAVLTATRARAVLKRRGGVAPAPPAGRIRRQRTPSRERLRLLVRFRRAPCVSGRACSQSPATIPRSCVAPCEHCIGVRSGRMGRRIERASAHPCCLLILHHPDSGGFGFPP